MLDGADLIPGISALIGVLAAFAAFWTIGRLVPGRESWERLLAGWAIAYVASVVAAVCGIANLKIVLALCALILIVALIVSRPKLERLSGSLFNTHRQGFALWLAAIALLALGLVTPPVFWDSYAHWLPNSSYLYQFDHFAEAPLVNFPSLHPTYPNALPFIIYISSVITGRFTELAGNIVNVVMLLVAMGCANRLLREEWPLPNDGDARARASGYLLAAVAFCIAVPLNPAIEVQYYWSAIADPALAVLVFVMIAECSRLMTREDSVGVRATLFLLFLLGCLTGGLKPNAWPLAFILIVSAAFVGTIHGIGVRRWLPPAAAILAGTLFTSILWKLYLRSHLPIPDQFVIRPFAKWSFDLWKDLLFAMLEIVRSHTRYSVVVLLTMAVGLLSLLRRSFIANPTSRVLVGFVSVAMALHVASLFAAYLGTGFEDWMIQSASSFPRYTSQVGYAVCLTGLMLLALKVLPMLSSVYARLSPAAVATLCAIGCAGFFVLVTVRQTLALVPSSRENTHRRHLALAALKNVRPGDRFTTVGTKWSYNYLRYGSWVDLEPGERPTLVDRFFVNDTDSTCDGNKFLAQWRADPTIDAILFVDARDFAARCARDPSPDQLWQRSIDEWHRIELDRPEENIRLSSKSK